MSKLTIRVLGCICLVLGVIFLGVSMALLVRTYSDAGETERIGSGEFAINMPKTTVFQEMGVFLIGILGATLITAGIGCEIAARIISFEDRAWREMGYLDRRLASLSLSPAHPPPKPSESRIVSQTPEKEQAGGLLGPSAQNQTTKPTTSKKIKTKCGGCGKVVTGGSDWAGRICSCPYCNCTFGENVRN